MSKIVLFPNTLSQLEAIKHHAKSSLSGNQFEDQIWLEDITAINNAIEIIKAYQNQTLKKENILESPIIKRVKEYIEELKGLISIIPTTVHISQETYEGVDCPDCGSEREVCVLVDRTFDIPELNGISEKLDKLVSDFDYYILSEELKAKKKSNAI